MGATHLGDPLEEGSIACLRRVRTCHSFTYWKGTIKPGTSSALVCQMDLLTSLATLVGSDVELEDSEDLLAAFLGESSQGREELVIEASTRTALRKGDWVMIPPYGGQKVSPNVQIELGNSDEFQLYNLKEDIGETQNLAESNPDKLQELIAGIRKD